MDGLLEYTFLHMFCIIFKPKIKLKESYHSRCPACWVVGTRWYVGLHPLYHSDEQLNAIVKGVGGAICIIDNESALQHWMVGGQELARMICELSRKR